MFIKILLALIYVILAVFLIIVVLLQESKEAGLSGAITGAAETFFGQNRGRTPDAIKKRFTAYGAFAFIILSLILAYIVIHG